MPARTSLARAVHRTLSQRIPSAPPLPVGSATLALVGPGGSGKTACCAALLDAYRERSTLPAACATIVLGEARSELAVLLSPHILEPTPIAAPPVAEALRHAREEGLLLLDLPALSPADRSSIRALAGAAGDAHAGPRDPRAARHARRQAGRAAAGGPASARCEHARDHPRRRDRSARGRRGGRLRLRPRTRVSARSRTRSRRAASRSTRPTWPTSCCPDLLVGDGARTRDPPVQPTHTPLPRHSR